MTSDTRWTRIKSHYKCKVCTSTQFSTSENTTHTSLRTSKHWQPHFPRGNSVPHKNLGSWVTPKIKVPCHQPRSLHHATTSNHRHHTQQSYATIYKNPHKFILGRSPTTTQGLPPIKDRATQMGVDTLTHTMNKITKRGFTAHAHVHRIISQFNHWPREALETITLKLPTLRILRL